MERGIPYAVMSISPALNVSAAARGILPAGFEMVLSQAALVRTFILRGKGSFLIEILILQALIKMIDSHNQ
jgi:hypothetical protein